MKEKRTYYFCPECNKRQVYNVYPNFITKFFLPDFKKDTLYYCRRCKISILPLMGRNEIEGETK